MITALPVRARTSTIRLPKRSVEGTTLPRLGAHLQGVTGVAAFRPALDRFERGTVSPMAGSAQRGWSASSDRAARISTVGSIRTARPANGTDPGPNLFDFDSGAAYQFNLSHAPDGGLRHRRRRR